MSEFDSNLPLDAEKSATQPVSQQPAAAQSASAPADYLGQHRRTERPMSVPSHTASADAAPETAVRTTIVPETPVSETPIRPTASSSMPAALVPSENPTAAAEAAKPNKKRSGLWRIAAVIAAAAVIGLGSVGIYRTFFEKSAYSSKHPDFSLNEVETPQTDTTIKSSGELLTPAQVAAKVRPSIVSVITNDNINNGAENGQGSGIIVDSDGYIVTNSHVIGDSSKYDISVITSDGTTYEAQVLGYDTRSDLAVLKVKAKGLPACELGDSTKLVLGDYVLAIGNPGGVQFAGSVTYGIVSGVDRIIDTADTESTSAMRYIQTDAAINPGNSGGALVNMYGQVIGVNTSKISASGYEGMGFAVPSATVKTVIKDLIDYGYVQGRVKLGITCRVISAAYAGDDVPAGLQIVEVQSDSDMNGKVRTDDIITHCDGKRVESLSQLQDVMFAKKPGDTVELTLYRPYTTGGDNSYTVKVKLLEDTGSKEETSGSQEQQSNDFFDNYNGGKKY